MLTEFCKKNIKHKMKFMQEEHEKVLKLLYNNACEQKTVKNYEFQPHVIPHITYRNLMKTLGDMDNFVLDVCLTDLTRLGFAYRNVYANGNVEYGIKELGLKYIEYKQTQITGNER